MKRASPLVLAALVLALACRLAFGFGYWRDKPLTRDEREYLDLAQRAATGYGLTYADAADRFSRAPLYPLFLAVVLRVAGDHERHVDSTPGSIKLAQSVLGVAAVWIIAVLAGRLAGPRAAAAAALIAAVYPPFVFLCAYVFSETLYLAIALGSVTALARVIDDDRDLISSPRGWTIMAGVRCGFAALTRPAHLLFVACACAWLAYRRQWVLGVVLGATVAITIAPWTIRNARLHHRVIPIAAEGGVTFWTGNHPLARGEGDLAANPQLKFADLEFRRAHAGVSTEDLEPLYYRAAFAWIRERPLDWVALVARKLFYFWVPIGPSYRLHSTRYVTTAVVSYLALLPFAAAGAWRLRRQPVRPRALALFVASGVLTALIFMPQERFRIPVLDPALVVCAATMFAAKGTPDPFAA